MISLTSGMASRADAAVCVAPKILAESRLAATGIHRDDVLRAHRAGALQRVHPDTAGADHHHGVARFGARRHRRRAPSGADPARHQGGGMERNRLVDLDDGPFREHRVLGEGAELPVGQQVFRTEMAAAGPVGGHLAHEQAGADVADVALAVHAEPAAAARRDERQRHVVARAHRRHVGPDFRDDTGALVTAEQREPVRRGLTARGDHLGRRHHVTGEQMVVGVADPGDGHPHQHLTAARRVELDLGDLPVPADPADHGGTTLHCGSLLSGGVPRATPGRGTNPSCATAQPDSRSGSGSRPASPCAP